MNYHRSDNISLHEACLLSVDLEKSINGAEYEGSDAFKHQVLSILSKHNIVAADLKRPVVGDGVWTLLQYLRGNPEMPWNVLSLLRDWDSRFSITGYDTVVAWVGAQEFRGC